MKNQRVERLRTTVDFLPPETKRAMLDGLERNRIITGANTDRRGGMCPMIAADRNAFQSGPMADIFAHVWDSYNGACILNRRDATERDLRVLKTMLETSLANSPEYSSELGQAWLDYHVGAGPATHGPEIDFDLELTTALEQSALLDTGSFPPAQAVPSPRKVELVYDGDPVSTAAARPPIAGDPAGRSGARPAAGATGTRTTSPYEPYTIASPKRRAPAARGPVDQPGRSRAARHAAQTTASVERAQARAIIANQAATLRGRDWPRSATTSPGAPTAVEAPRREVAAPTPLEAPAIRQAAIPQLRSADDGRRQASGPAGPGRPREAAGDRTSGELQGLTGWSWLPPFRSYDDHDGHDRHDRDPLETTGGGLASDPRDVPEVQPSADQGRPVRT